ncbi:CtsR family transcriptional regulator [Lactococcus formosensis]|jgi:transcriptional regulator CtsR|uniref:Transcriptional regulator CtsR n=1 Tax=Lactococcus formosensis TaxID=1281486 RepID=A0A9X4P632_9LACT|nr:CtsR family transcriptional regulator [Lactococcus formosensis]NHI72845.1 CtsR family transcriptional regulator [Lactococcus garvieae]MCH1723219.1 CtsR family transcriptional regulator [Lactococcus formosensis]MCO7179669.1 CtsR family transcriptional regulator [Lactococcus formosensis]MDG6110760.1 CtsR family transcriptional regulator [Lactococcus formosensis]MDG6112944.1 CtsR family transcriptional regulator [Lactococcus formosensis]
MSAQNTSDIIEAYLRKLLEEAREIEIKRADLASQFDVVPSQINYVIKTRFTPSKGFDVESKRGGGGYIKIFKYHYSAKHEFLLDLAQKLPTNLTESMAQDVLQLLFDEHILTEREGNLLLLLLADSDISNSCRAQMMIKILQRLDRDDEI